MVISSIGVQQSVFQSFQVKRNQPKNVSFGLLNNLQDKISGKTIMNVALCGTGAGGVSFIVAGVKELIKHGFENFDLGITTLSSSAILLGAALVGGTAYAARIIQKCGYPGE